MHLYRLGPIPQQVDGLLEAVGLPMPHMHVHAIPPNKAHEGLLLLPLILQILQNPSMSLRHQPLRIHNHLLHEVLEVLVVRLFFRLGEPAMEVDNYGLHDGSLEGFRRGMRR